MPLSKDITSNIIALTGSWGMTAIAGLMQSVGFEIPAIAGDADLLTASTGFAASFLTVALGIRRIFEGWANSKLTIAAARKANAEAKAIELKNKQVEQKLANYGQTTM